MEKYLRLSVHQLVDFLLRTGDIDNRVFNRSTMQEGSRIHAFYQSKQSDNYFAEYALKQLIVRDEIQIILEGRADGIIKNKDGSYTIDEIKTTVDNLDDFYKENAEWHLGQAKCYAYMFAKEQKLDEIGIKLTYIRQGEEKDKVIKLFNFKFYDLEDYVLSLLDEYLDFYNIILRRNAIRNETIKNLEFPYENYRPGQKEIAKYTYAIAKNGGRLFCEAPTGIGKTISTLFPSIKSLENDTESKIFYLTSKSSGKENAKKAVELMKEKGLSLSEIVITAKDKICFCKGKACNPDECPFTVNYYNKVRSILSYIISSYSNYDVETIESIAMENRVCPFELQLDLSLFSDVIICDYNYLFHPISYLKRFFDEDATHHIALIDEAHNLVERSKEMYSASLSYKKFKDVRKSVRHSKLVKLKNILSKVNKEFESLKETYKEQNEIVDAFPDSLIHVLDNFVTKMQDITKNNNSEVSHELMDYYLDVNQFLKILEFVNEKYLLFFENINDDITINAHCMDASAFLRKTLSDIKGSVFFSATLTPLKYYLDTLGGDYANDPSIALASPFPKENLKILIAPKVSIRYKDREFTYGLVKDYIESFIKGKVGNYFVYVPSYEYLEKLTYYFSDIDYDIVVQEKDMTEKDKEKFLENFQPNPTKTKIGFVVLGGAFGEGIDLVSDRLIGAVIVGIGLPKINFKSNKIQEYYDNIDLPGYSYAYLNPGMNKVLQAIGRVIRSETDRGAVLLIDERYMNKDYKDLFKEEWRTYDVVYNPFEVEEEIINFFKE